MPIKWEDPVTFFARDGEGKAERTCPSGVDVHAVPWGHQKPPGCPHCACRGDNADVRGGRMKRGWEKGLVVPLEPLLDKSTGTLQAFTFRGMKLLVIFLFPEWLLHTTVLKIR